MNDVSQTTISKKSLLPDKDSWIKKRDLVFEAAAAKSPPFSIPKSPKTSALLEAYKEIAGIKKEDYSLSSQTIASKLGYDLELITEASLALDNEKWMVHKGVEITAEIKKLRRNNSSDTSLLQETFLFSPEVAQNLLTLKSLSFPDLIIIDHETTSITSVEMKASGNNDSSSVPKNLDKLVAGTTNSAVTHWRDSGIDYRPVLMIGATRLDKRGNYEFESRWKNEAAKRPEYSKIVVASNSEAYNLLSEKPITEEEYNFRIIQNTARLTNQRREEAEERIRKNMASI